MNEYRNIRMYTDDLGAEMRELESDIRIMESQRREVAARKAILREMRAACSVLEDLE